MACERCREHFCTTCLEKDGNEYRVLARSEAMWFCPPCHVTVQTNLKTEFKIEKKCAELMGKYEERIKKMKKEFAKKCEEKQVKEELA